MKAEIDFNSIETKINNILIDELKESDATFGEVMTALDNYADKVCCNHHFHEYVRAQISRYMTSQNI